ncbi:MAG: hypothetical protein KDC44_19055, partial [Phaeodactylibacter sp.]|nr:hypothetical protein [Phaeodactylibacter sp.]
MREYLPLLLFFVLFLQVSLSAQVKENTPTPGKTPELDDPLYTRNQGQWIELSLRDIRELISPQILTERFPDLDALLDQPKWLLKIVSNEQDELYFIDALGQTVLLEKDFSPAIEALQSEIEALNLRLNDPAKNAQSPLQITHIDQDTIFFSNGAQLVLPQPEVTKTIQQLEIDGLTLSITEGNSINLAEILTLDCCSDNQTLELSGSMLSIFGGNTVDLSRIDEDSNPKNELQELSLEGNKLSISKGNSVLLPFGDLLSGMNPGTAKSGTSLGCGLALVPDYATLRSQPPLEDSLVFVYGAGIRGFFWRVDEAQPDGGTVISSSKSGQSILWQRVRPPGFFKLDWWKIGDPMPSGLSGDTIRSAADVLNIIMEVSKGGAIIDVSGDNSPRTIVLDKSVLLYGDVVITGAGDTFKRMDAVWTTLTSSAGPNASTLSVASSEGFHKGGSILVVNGNGFQQNNGKTKTIKQVQEGGLQIQGTLGTAMAAGDTVTTAFTLFKANGAAPIPLRRLIFNNVNFDGNWPNNTFTHDWRFNNTINISSNVGTRVVIENAYFRRTPSENIIVGNLTLRDTEADSLAGSLVHISTSLDTTIGVLVENVRAKNVNMMTHALMGHSEGFIVSSASPQYIKLHKILAINGREAFVGDLGGGTDYWEIQDCRVQNFKHITVGRLSATQKKISGLRILNNQFINCNQLGIANGSLLSSRYTDRPRIENNLFVNSGIHLEGSIGANVTGNQFLYDAALGGYASSITQDDFELPMGALVYFSDFHDLNFSDN